MEAFPNEKQFASPLAENNQVQLQSILGMPVKPAASGSFFDQTIFGRRRELADWARLQLYGVPWAVTGIDQDYPVNYPAAEIDLEPDNTFHNLKPGDDLHTALAWDVLQKGMDLTKSANLPTLLVNEPILISNGANREIRYNFYYPRWAYDAYRTELQMQAGVFGWNYVDVWDIAAMDQFTNSAIHLTPLGEDALAKRIAASIQIIPCK